MTDFNEAQRVAGSSIYPAPGVYTSIPEDHREDLQDLITLLKRIEIDPSELEQLDTFEEMFAALYTWKFKTMLGKQKDYGPENITKAGEKGILTRAQDKVERNKVLIGDSDRQVNDLKKLYEENEPETLTEMNTFLNRLEGILYPQAQNESIEDTWGDLGNYGDIGVTVHVGAWPKPLSS